MEKTISEKITQGFLLLCGLSFLLIGANTFHDPLAAMAPVELNINTVSALNELRANYGGLQIGMGLFLLAGLCCKTMTRPALLAQALIVGGLALGRFVSIALDGQPNEFVQGLIVLESVTALLSLALFLRHPKTA
mgnify:FL=1